MCLHAYTMYRETTHLWNIFTVKPEFNSSDFYMNKMMMQTRVFQNESFLLWKFCVNHTLLIEKASIYEI